ncbi:MAG: hypothetical protein AB7E13_09455 [Arcobacteraceae bacterium]
MDTLVALSRIQLAFIGRRLNLQDEKRLQADICTAFDLHNIPYTREEPLDNGVVDFMVGGLAIEVKIRGRASAMNIYRQLERYSQSDRVEAILLITSHTMSIPETINNKPAYLLRLGRTQL